MKIIIYQYNCKKSGRCQTYNPEINHKRLNIPDDSTIDEVFKNIIMCVKVSEDHYNHVMIINE